VALIIGLGLRGAVFESTISTEFDFTSTPDSKKAANLIEERLRGSIGTNEVILLQSDSLTVDDPAYADFVVELLGKVEALGPDIIKAGTLISYLDDAPFPVSQDRRTVIIPFTMAGEFTDATDNISKVIAVADEAKGRGFKVLMTGQATVGNDFEEVVQDGLLKGEAIGVPVALIILILVFGAVVAALLPVTLAIFSIFVAVGAATLFGLVFSLSFFVESMINMIGLAVGIDYSLFIVHRYREERARGLQNEDAIARTAATAGRTVVFSGVAVGLGLTGTLLVPSNVFITIGMGGHLRGHRRRLRVHDPSARPAGPPGR